MVQTIYCQKVIEKHSTHLVFKGLSVTISVARIIIATQGRKRN